MRMHRARVFVVTTLLAGGLPFLVAVPPAYAAPPGCDAGAESDFNNDGRADTVVADPGATVDGQAEAGRVLVLYGDADGLVGEGARGYVQQGLEAVGGVADAGDRFGASLAAGDANCDGFTDLLVGTPNEDISGKADSGYAQLIYGSVAGLGAGADSVNYTQTNFGRPVTAGDQFGYAVDLAEDVGQSGAAAPTAYAIAVGVPGGDVGGDNDAGYVGVRAPLEGGTVATTISQDTAGVPGVAEPGDRFGFSVALDYFLGGASLIDVAVGAPYEDQVGAVDGGNVTIVRDVTDEPDGAAVYDQDVAGVANVVEPGDRFGYGLDSVRVGSTTRLAVGVPYEDGSGTASSGLVQLFSGTGSTLTAGAGITQDTAGVANVAETGDLFGQRVAWAAPGLGDAVTRLAVAAPAEDGVGDNTGLVQVFPVTNLAAEMTYTQDSTGVPGVAEAGDKFGSALAVVAGPGERALLVGVPDDGDNATGMVDVIPFGGANRRAWIPGVGGLPAGGAARFGAALASSG